MEQINRNEFSPSIWGIGIFSVSEASSLTGISRSRLRRWLTGYTWRNKDREQSTEAIWRRQLPEFEDVQSLGFLDLIEARFVDAFRKAGVPWSEIKSAAAKACDLLQVDHPFSSHRFVTDGRRIFAELLSKQGEEKLLELSKSQFAFEKVVRPSLYKNLDFDEAALRWWWLGKKRSVVIDPQRQFGTPIVAREGVPTRALYDAYVAEESFVHVAAIYDVEKSSVRDAVEFERRIAA